MKKILSCLMAILMCFSVFPITAFADDADLKAKVTSEELVAYETGYETDIYTDYWQPGMFENDEIEAALNVRDNMLDRNKEFTIVLTTDREPDFFSDIVKDLVMLATDEELAEKPIHGDYLRYQFEQYKCTADLNYDGYYYTYYIDFDFKYYTTYEQEQQMNTRVNSLMLSLVDDGDSEYAKVKKIYDYICDNVTYDYTNLNKDSYKLKYTAYAALFNKTSVCQGYATLLYRLAREAGLNTRIVSNDDHSWNIVQIGNEYYNLDATWDATVRQSGGEYVWFLRNMKNFEHADHIRDNSFDERFEEEHPMSATDYDPSNDVVDTHEHTPKTVNAKAATCGTDGYTGDVICAECEEVLEQGVVIPATGNHTWNEGVITTEATEEADGVKTYTCLTCGTTKTEAVKFVPVEKPDPIDPIDPVDPVDPTPDEPDEPKPPVHTHNYKATVVASTCVDRGYTIYVCECGDEYISDYTAATGHQWDEGKLIESTCVAAGSKIYTCTVCGATKEETLDKATHEYETIITKATLNQNGSIVTKCVKCGSVSDSIAIYMPKDFTLRTTDYVYDGTAKTPTVVIKDSAGKTIGTENYTVEYLNNITIGTATAKITFIGNYEGTISLDFAINPANTTITKTTSGCGSFTVTWDEKSDANGYQIQYATKSNFSDAKTITLDKVSYFGQRITGLDSGKQYYVRIRTYQNIDTQTYYSAWSDAKAVKTATHPTDITLSANTFVYNGKTRQPSVTVKNNSMVIDSKYYTVSYVGDRIEVGTYDVVITFKAPFSGVVTKSFQIVPPWTYITSLTPNENSFTVQWNKQDAQITGYQIEYSTTPAFTDAKTITVTKATQTEKEVEVAEGSYYVRVRTYKDMSTGNYYSSWSAVRTVFV